MNAQRTYNAKYLRRKPRQYRKQNYILGTYPKVYHPAAHSDLHVFLGKHVLYQWSLSLVYLMITWEIYLKERFLGCFLVIPIH